MGPMSKNKGSAFERWVCRELSRWLTHGLREDLFWRASMSGGRATIGFRKGKKHSSQAGDISAVDAKGYPLVNAFVIECKHVRDLEIGSAVFGAGNLVGFWKRLLEQAKNYRKTPLLIAKQNNRPPLVIVNPTGAILLQLYAPLAVLGGGLGLELHLLDRLVGQKPPKSFESPWKKEGGTKVGGRVRSSILGPARGLESLSKRVRVRPINP